tara:strand:- start:230 stop:640 length:411 start_codon:yes stop_codon:yes gene_type:complete
LDLQDNQFILYLKVEDMVLVIKNKVALATQELPVELAVVLVDKEVLVKEELELHHLLPPVLLTPLILVAKVILMMVAMLLEVVEAVVVVLVRTETIASPVQVLAVKVEMVKHFPDSQHLLSHLPYLHQLDLHGHLL